MRTQITEQATFLVDSLANQDEARDLDSQRASSFLDPADFIPTSGGSQQSVNKTAVGRGFFAQRIDK